MKDEPAMKRNDAVLNDSPGDLHTVEANDKILDNYKYPVALIQAAQNQSKNIRGLVKLLKSNIRAKVMLIVNVDIQGLLTNGQTRNIRHTEFAQGSVLKVYVKFSEKQAGLKTMRYSYLGR